MAQEKVESHVWTDNEGELLLNIAVEVDARKLPSEEMRPHKQMFYTLIHDVKQKGKAK